MSDKPHSSGWLAGLGEFCFRRPLATLAVSLLLAVVSVYAAATRLTLETDWLVLFSEKHPEIQQLRFWRQNIPGSKDMAILVSGGSLKDRQQAVDELGQELEKSQDLLESPLYSLPADLFLQSGLFYLSQELLESLTQDTQTLARAVHNVKGDQLNMELLTERLLETPEGRTLVLRFLRTLEQRTRSQPEDEPARLFPKIEPEDEQVRKLMSDLDGPGDKVYLSLDDGVSFLVLVSPRLEGRSLDASGPAVAEIRRLVSKARAAHPRLDFSLTGEPVLVVDERNTIAGDSIRGTLCSIVLVLLLFRFGFRELTRPTLALVTLLVGLLWTVGCTALTIGHLNFITVTYIPILVGIGIDFAIHVTFRYYECRQSEDGVMAIRQTMASAGKDTSIGALTTSVAFAVLVLVGFRGVAELGMIAFFGVLLCQVSACTLLPAMLALMERRNYSLPPRGRQELRSWFETCQAWNGPLLSMGAILTLLGLLGSFYVQFDIHLLKMQNPNLESVKTELMLVASGRSSVLTALVPAQNTAEARELEAKLRRLPSVAQVIGVSTFLPRIEPRETELAAKLVQSRPDILKLMDAFKNFPALNANSAQELFRRLELAELIHPEPTALSPQRQEMKAATDRLRQRLEERGPGPLIDAINQMLKELDEESGASRPLMERQTGTPLDQLALPSNLRGRLAGRDGQLALKVFPKLDIWRSEELHRFLGDVRKVSENVSGEPVLIELFERVVLETHWRGIGYSLLAMTCLLLIVLRNIRLAFLAAVPTAVSLLNVLGFMGLFGMSFNPANFVAVPMLLGLGSVFGLHSILRMKELGNAELLCCSTGPAILLSSATSAAGFASLGLAAHRGIASLGILVTLGLVVNAILSLFILPCLVARFPGLLGKSDS